MFSLRNKRNARRHTNISSTLKLPEPDDRFTENSGKYWTAKYMNYLASSCGELDQKRG
jgi:hypothetical protein